MRIPQVRTVVLLGAARRPAVLPQPGTANNPASAPIRAESQSLENPVIGPFPHTHQRTVLVIIHSIGIKHREDR